MVFYVLSALLIVAALVLPSISQHTPRRARLAGVLLGLAGLELTASMQIAGVPAGLGLMLVAAGVYFAKDAWSEYSQGLIIRRGDAAVARAAAAREAE